MDIEAKIPTIPSIENKVIKYKMSAHFIEQKLKYGKKAEETGIKLTCHQDRMTHALMILYKKKNQESNSKNSEVITRTVDYGSKNPQKCITVTIICTEKELLNEFYGKKKPSGSDIKHLREILEQLANKKFHIQYRKVLPKKSGESFIDETNSLIKIHSTISTKNPKGTKTYKIELHPIFTDQIEKKYVLFPECIHERTVKASKKMVSEPTIRLRDFFLSEISASRYKCQLNEDTAIFRLHLEKNLLTRKKIRAIDHLSKSIQVCIKLGIISKYEVTNGAEGQKKYVFYLQKPTGLLSHPYGVIVAK